MSIGYGKQTGASVPLPPVGESNTFIDVADDKLKRKESTGTIVSIEDVAAGVASFEGRVGVIASAAGDYTASEVTNVPTAPITAITVQAALDQLASWAAISPTEKWGLVTGADNVSDALSKLQYTQMLQKVQIAQNVTIPAGFVWLRECTQLMGTSKITLQGTARMRLI